MVDGCVIEDFQRGETSTQILVQGSVVDDQIDESFGNIGDVNTVEQHISPRVSGNAAAIVFEQEVPRRSK